MKRRLPAWSAIASVVSLAGCAMCQSPFDYCGPVMGPGGPNCDFGARRGSIYAPMDDSYAAAPMSPTPAEPPIESGASDSDESSSETTVSHDAVDTLVR